MTAPDPIIAHRASCPALCQWEFLEAGSSGAPPYQECRAGHHDHRCACTAAAELRELVEVATVVVDAFHVHDLDHLDAALAPFREKPLPDDYDEEDQGARYQGDE